MNLIDINQSLELFDDVYRQLEETKNNGEAERLSLDINFQNNNNKLTQQKQNLLQNKINDLKKTDYLFEIQKQIRQDYKAVNNYLWAIFVSSILLTVLFIYFWGLSSILLLLLGINVATYMAGKSMKYHTDNLSSNPPFYYKWFKRPTFSDREALARAKYKAEKQIIMIH